MGNCYENHPTIFRRGVLRYFNHLYNITNPILKNPSMILLADIIQNDGLNQKYIHQDLLPSNNGNIIAEYP